MAEDAEKEMTKCIQEIIKAKKEGFAECMQVVNKGSESRMSAAFKHSTSVRDTGASQQESSSFSREASGMMG